MRVYLPTLLQARAALYQKKLCADDFGGFIESWHQVNFVWASIRLVSTRSFTQSQSVGQRMGSYEVKDAFYEIIMRQEIQVAAGMRLHWDKKILVIVSDSVRQINKQFQMVYASLLKPSEGGSHV